MWEAPERRDLLLCLSGTAQSLFCFPVLASFSSVKTYSFLLFVAVMFSKVDIIIDLVNTEPLLLGEYRIRFLLAS